MTAEPPRENTYVIDPESAAEQVRILHQDRLATRAMGGPLSELEPSVIEQMHSILDLACGPGAWVLEMAYDYPRVQVTGVDISHRMLDYAQALAREQHVHNATFQFMNVLDPLKFPDNSFDLVNARALFAFMSPPDWPRLVKECMRILKPGGFLRLTEIEAPISNGAAAEKMTGFFLKAMHKTGRSFSPDGRTIGITPMLGTFMRQAGFEKIRSFAYPIDSSYGADYHDSQSQNIAVVNLNIKPFIVKSGVTTGEEFEETYQQLLTEMHSEGFSSILFMLTVLGQKLA